MLWCSCLIARSSMMGPLSHGPIRYGGPVRLWSGPADLLAEGSCQLRNHFSGYWAWVGDLIEISLTDDVHLGWSVLCLMTWALRRLSALARGGRPLFFRSASSQESSLPILRHRWQGRSTSQAIGLKVNKRDVNKFNVVNEIILCSSIVVEYVAYRHGQLCMFCKPSRHIRVFDMKNQLHCDLPYALWLTFSFLWMHRYRILNSVQPVMVQSCWWRWNYEKLYLDLESPVAVQRRPARWLLTPVAQMCIEEYARAFAKGNWRIG